MNIEDMRIGELLNLMALLKNEKHENVNHPMLNKHCVIRTYSAGVHIGTPVSINGTEVLLKNARRIWKWEGAFTLSEVSIEGVKSESRISKEVPEIFLTQVIEFLPTTEKARKKFEACNE